jgi:hypothetical protein
VPADLIEAYYAEATQEQGQTPDAGIRQLGNQRLNCPAS